MPLPHVALDEPRSHQSWQQPCRRSIAYWTDILRKGDFGGVVMGGVTTTVNRGCLSGNDTMPYYFSWRTCVLHSTRSMNSSIESCELEKQRDAGHPFGSLSFCLSGSLTDSLPALSKYASSCFQSLWVGVGCGMKTRWSAVIRVI